MSTTNTELVRGWFDAWSAGTGNFFASLHDDVRWTITGTGLLAGTYTSRQEFVDKAIVPIGARLAEPIRPTVQSIVADGDRVVILWSGHAVATDGQAYDNTYSWHLTIVDGMVTEATAFFDSPTLDALFAVGLGAGLVTERREPSGARGA